MKLFQGDGLEQGPNTFGPWPIRRRRLRVNATCPRDGCPLVSPPRRRALRQAACSRYPAPRRSRRHGALPRSLSARARISTANSRFRRTADATRVGASRFRRDALRPGQCAQPSYVVLGPTVVCQTSMAVQRCGLVLAEVSMTGLVGVTARRSRGISLTSTQFRARSLAGARRSAGIWPRRHSPIGQEEKRCLVSPTRISITGLAIVRVPRRGQLPPPRRRIAAPSRVPWTDGSGGVVPARRSKPSRRDQFRAHRDDVGRGHLHHPSSRSAPTSWSSRRKASDQDVENIEVTAGATRASMDAGVGGLRTRSPSRPTRARSRPTAAR